jgi:hypothetical protein
MIDQFDLSESQAKVLRTLVSLNANQMHWDCGLSGQDANFRSI